MSASRPVLRRRWWRWSAAVLLVMVGLHAWMFWPVRLSIGTLPADLALPAAQPPEGMALYALPTGVMHSRALYAFRGGSPFDAREFAMTAYLVRHPRGDLLIDTGLGRGVARQYAGLPWLMRMNTAYRADRPAADQLAAAGIAPAALAGVILTHAHWDHVSGLPDLADAPVWVDAEEAAFIASGQRGAELAHGMVGVRYQPYRFEHGPYLGYPRSHDVWGDGAIVIVPAPGHTPGSVIVFVTLPGAQRWAFIGDIAWQQEGVERPAERPWISRALVDHDAAGVRAQLQHLAALRQRFPELRIVPAHDARPAAGLPTLPAGERSS